MKFVKSSDRIRSSGLKFPVLGFCLGLIAMQAHAWSPGTGTPTAVSGFTVDITNRRDVLAYYQCVYNASQGFATNVNWTGNIATATAGTTSATFKDDVRRRVNFYRALVGQPGDITFDATKSSKAQEAALMMSANNNLSHDPPSSWSCYTANGDAAAAASNLALGNYGPAALDAYMRDDGGGNEVVGHRRWIAYSRAQSMGTGDVPAHGAYNSANSLWVIGDFKASPTAKFTLWPNEGFVPANLVPTRWSLSYPNATFGAAIVSVTQNGSPVSTSIISRNAINMGDNTLVWTVSGLPSTVTSDVPYVVNVSGIGGGGPATKTYTVNLFNPDILGESVTVSGTATPLATGQAYSINSIAQADSYQLAVSAASTAAWTEGAEDSPTPKITEAISPGYSLRQTGVKRTGAKAFQLAFPSGYFSDQAFVVTRSVIPSATSQLRYFDLGRFATTNTTLATQVSTDGATWTTLFTRNGVGLSSGLFDQNWVSRSFSLSAYAGQMVQFRFIMQGNSGSVVQGVTSDRGFFIDDISVTNASELANDVITPLAGNATGFTLNATTAGTSLVAGQTFIMRVRPNVGTKWFAYGAMKTVTVTTPPGYATWISTNYPAVTGSFNLDHDKDGIPNGVEYAFQLNPTVSNPGTSLPQVVKGVNTLSLSYTQPAIVTGVTYGVQSSENLSSWADVTDTGSGNNHVFTVSTTGKPKVFLRHKIVLPP